MTGIILPGSTDAQRRHVERALLDPHGASERFDPEFVLAWECIGCGEIGQAQRKYVHEAAAEHALKCPSYREGDALHVRVVYPKQ